MKFDVFISYSHVDAPIASALKRALHRFTKPWYKLRALSAFQDQSNLNASPALWFSIEDALAQSRYLLLLASEEAASSEWVAREVRWWLEHRSAETLLIALTGGEVGWDGEAEDFDWQRTTALPQVLRGVFSSEPLYVDLRWAAGDTNLSTKVPGFRSAVLDLAAPIHGRSKEDLAGADVRRHRQTKRLAGIVSVVLASLAIAAFWQMRRADQARREASDASQLSHVRQLFARARAEYPTSPPRGLLLAIEAERQAREGLGRGVPGFNGFLTDALEGAVPSRVIGSTGKGRIGDILVSPDRRWLVTDTGWLIDLSSDSEASASEDFPRGIQLELPETDFPGRPYEVADLSFSPDGDLLAVATDGHGARLFDLRAPGKPPLELFADHPVVAVDFDADGDRLALAGNSDGRDGLTVMELDGETRRRTILREAEGTSRVLRPIDVRFSGADGLLVLRGIELAAWAQGEAGREVPLGRLATLYSGTRFDQGPGRLLALSDRGHYVAGVDRDRLLVHRISDGRRLVDVPLDPAEPALRVDFSADERFVAWALNGSLEVRALDEPGRRVRQVPLSFSPAWVEIAPGGDRVAVAAEDDPFVRVWGPGGDRDAPRLVGHDTRATAGVFVPDEQSLYTGSLDGRVRRSDLAAESRIEVTKSFGAGSVNLGPRNRYAVVETDDGRELRDLETGQVRPLEVGRARTLDFRFGESTDSLWAVAMRFNPQTGSVYEPRDEPDSALAPRSLHRGGELIRWSLSGGERRPRPFTLPDAYDNGPLTVLSPEEQILVAGTYTCQREPGGSAECDAAVVFFDAQRPDREPVSLSGCCEGAIATVEFDPSGRWLLVTTARRVYALDWEPGLTLAEIESRSAFQLPGFRGEEEFGGGARFSPDGKTLAVAASGRLFLWRDEETHWRLIGVREDVESHLGFLDDGRVVATLESRPGTVVVTDPGGYGPLVEGGVAVRLEDLAPYSRIALDPLGPWALAEVPVRSGRHRLMRWALDGRVPRWPGRLLDLEQPGSLTWFLGPDGYWLQVARHERQKLVLNDPVALIAAACRAAGRNLTGSEWEGLGGSSQPYEATCSGLPIPPDARTP